MTPLFTPALLQRYVSQGQHQVEGWLLGMSGQAIAALADAQQAAGVRGAVAEIGVHHGRLFILLSLCRAAGEAAVAIDLFEEQAQNIDASGQGSKARLQANLVRHGADVDVTVLPANSLQLTAADLPTPVRLFSVDGGHTPACANNDMRLAAACLADGGIIILDDAFNASWPGVMTGLVPLLQDPAFAVVPFLATPNKLYFTQPQHCRRYWQAMRTAFPDAYDKEDALFGHSLHIYGIWEKAPPAPTLLKRLRGRLARWIA
jgi:hypothetical protein